ncbi:MAG: hypothetical protein JKX70_09550 [Phycisphaerales bacterium]|nr:hypothetical protein [Phycisphaerales bacterium]
MNHHLFSGLIARSRPVCISMMCALMVMMVSVSSTVAMAQEELRPPKTSEAPSAPKYIIFLIAILMVGAVVFAATLKTKRTHQD